MYHQFIRFAKVGHPGQTKPLETSFVVLIKNTKFIISIRILLVIN